MATTKVPAELSATAITITTAAQPNITSVGTLTSLGLSGNVTLGDNNKAIFGAGSDLQIYHDGSHSRISDLGTGRILLETNGDSIRLTKGTTENMAIFTPDGSVQLYHNNSAKFETTSTGIDVTGTVVSDGLTVDGIGTFDNNGVISTAGNRQFQIRDSDNTNMQLYMIVEKAADSGTGAGLIQVTESGVSNDRDLYIQGHGGATVIGSQSISGGSNILTVSGDSYFTGNIGIGTSPLTHKFIANSSGNSNSVVRIDADDNRGANRYALDIVDDDTNSRGSVRISTASGQPVLIQHSTDGKGIQIDHTTVGGYSDILFTTKQNDGLQKVMHRLRSDMIDGTSGGEDSQLDISEKLGIRLDRNTSTYISSQTSYNFQGHSDTAGANYHELGSWTAGQGSRITIRINGAIGFSNNSDHAGETVIHGTISNNSDFEGFFYGVGSNSTATAVAISSPSTGVYKIFVLPGAYGSYEAYVHVSSGTVWTPKTSSNNTGSSSLPSGAVGLQSEFGVNISGTRKLLVNSSGNVGIGTSSFNATYDPRLQVTSAANDGTGGIFIENYLPTLTLQDISGGGAVSQIQQDQTNMLFKNNGSERMRIDSAGTIYQGGVTTPTLHSATTGIVFTNGSLLTDIPRAASRSINLAQNAAVDSGNTWTYLSTDEASLFQQFNGNHYFKTAASGSAGADITFDTKLFVGNTGNVGIGTSSPGASIDVRRNTNTVNNLDSLGFDVVGNIGNSASNPGNHYTSGLRLYQGSGTVGSGLGVMYLGADNGNATSENDYTGQMTAPNGMSGGLRLNTRHNDAKIRFYTTRSSTTALRMDIDHEGIDIQGVELYSSTSASLTTTATDFYVNSTGTITTGTYIIKITLQGGGWYSEAHTGIMRWYSGTTNNPTGDTIHLTGMGHANTVGTLNARVLRKYSNTNTHSLQLWLTSGSSSNHTITIEAAKIQD